MTALKPTKKIPLPMLLVSLLLCMPNNAYSQWFKDQQAIMGTEIRVELWHTDAQQAGFLIKLVMDEMRRIDQQMSPYRSNSELSKINQHAFKKAQIVSAELFGLIKKSIAISKLSDGAFDITFASIGTLYDYRKHIKPSQRQINNTLSAINYRHLILDTQQRTIRYAVEGVRIDLGGIAKGHAVDNAIRLLKQNGVQQALVSAGGDTRIMGSRGKRPWLTGIRDPRSDSKSAVMLPLDNAAISTSGDYERYFIENGVRYHHIISPSTGKSVSTSRSVSVIGPDSTTADALSTTLFVLGPSRALSLIESIAEFDAIIIDAHGKLLFSSGLLPAPKPQPQTK